MRYGLVVCLVLLLMPGAAAAAGECAASEWGAEDEAGAANRVTAVSVLEAVQLVKTGKVYSLGITVDSNTPAPAPRTLSLTIVQQPFSGLTYHDDLINGWLGIGSQIDGLAHFGEDGMYYNCNRAEDISALTGVAKLGLENLPPIVARGVLLDMAGHFGVRTMRAGQFFKVADVKAVEAKQGTPIREGDVVLFHTGWTDAKLKADPAGWISAAPGQSEEVAYYLARKGVVAVGADTWGVDVVPPQVESRPFQGHVIYLKENGIYILEAMNTGPLAHDGAHEFLFILGHAKIRGSVQMQVNPVAIH